MKAFILAAGKGTRLGELTEKSPKPMLPLAGRPLLEYTISWLKKYGIQELIINLHHLPQTVTSYFGDGTKFGVSILYSEEKALLGTAGALDPMRAHLQERFLLMYGDLLTNVDLDALIQWHLKKDAKLSMTVYNVEDPTRAGIVEMTADGRLVRFWEKPPREKVFSTLANAGIFIVEPEIIDFVPHNSYFDIGYDLLPALLTNGVGVYCHPINGYLLDIGIPTHYRQAQSDIVTKGLFS